MTEPAPVKGHWPKGKSRNLDPERVAAARVLVDLLRRAIDAGWRSPALGVLTVAVTAAHLKVDRGTVHKWCKGSRLPPLWVCDELRSVLRTYHP